MELVPGAFPQESDQFRQVVIWLIEVGDWNIQLRGKALCRLQIRYVLTPFVLVDTRTGNELVDAGKDSELLLRYASCLPGRL